MCLAVLASNILAPLIHPPTPFLLFVCLTQQGMVIVAHLSNVHATSIQEKTSSDGWAGKSSIPATVMSLSVLSLEI